MGEFQKLGARMKRYAESAPISSQEWCTDHDDCRCATASGLDVVRAVDLHRSPRPVRCIRGSCNRGSEETRNEEM